MQRTRLGLVSLLSLFGLALAVDPAAAQSGASTTASLINELNTDLLYIAIPVTLVTEAALVYAVLKFKDSGNASPTQENRRLEITWTIATAVILLFVGVASYGVLAQPDVTHTQSMEVGPEDDDVVVTAEAYQWGWNFNYEGANVTTSGTNIVLPVDQDIYFRVTTTDVLHGFAVPDMGLKQDAVPGQVNVLQTRTLETGTYQGYCTEFCGVAHSQMYFTVEVVSQEEFDQYIEERQQAKQSGN